MHFKMKNTLSTNAFIHFLIIAKLVMCYPVENNHNRHLRSADVENILAHSDEGSGNSSSIPSTSSKIHPGVKASYDPDFPINDGHNDYDKHEYNHNKNDAGTNKLDKVDETGAKIVSSVQKGIGGVLNIFGNIFDLAAKATVRGIDTAGQTVDALAKSKTADKLLEAGESLARTAVNAKRKVVDTVSRVGVAAAPAVRRKIEVVAKGAHSIKKLTLCNIICPFKNEEDKENCQNENCAGANNNYDGKHSHNSSHNDYIVPRSVNVTDTNI